MAERRADWLSGKSCVACGSREDLEVDHINGSEKVTHRVWSWSLKRREAELAKCQVLCGFHHKEKTKGDLYPELHGKHTTYVHRGCRCEECKAAHADVNRAWRKRTADHRDVA